VAYHGLPEARYPLADMRGLAESGDDPRKLEILISESLLHLARDLSGEDFDMAALYPEWRIDRKQADIPALLEAAVEKHKLDALFDRLAPRAPAYAALAGYLRDYRAIAAKGGWKPIEPEPALRLHDADARVAQLRARLEAEGYKAPPTGGHDKDFGAVLRQQLVAYQRRNGLVPDGDAGAKTLAALNVPVAARIEQIRATMERWRHMPRSYPPARYVRVNIPAFTVDIFENGDDIYRGQAIVGRPDRHTPFIDSSITVLTVNPPWRVPVSIARKDILPKLRHDPDYLEKLDIVIAGRDGDPFGTGIDWADMKPSDFHYRLRQMPGDMNSLGKLKFSFANPFDVYMHGTPHRELFSRSERAFSSGCVRLEDPLRVAELLLDGTSDSDGGSWDAAHIEAAIEAGETRWVDLARPIPVYFVYETVFSGDDGQINFRKDIYGYDAKLKDWFTTGAYNKACCAAHSPPLK
ncbi:MAG: L,D-transpeptidase family protein, partial [Alphaproteobacteria bacterium]|nr:L,D-transpeptidase family protein [Alphaproteobacteria bacterium]